MQPAWQLYQQGARVGHKERQEHGTLDPVRPGIACTAIVLESKVHLPGIGILLIKEPVASII